MWGEIKNVKLNKKIIQTIIKFIKILVKFRSCNLEIWLELLICYKLLKNKNIYKKETLNLFDINLKSKNKHLLYHTFALWSMYFCLL
jgi:hypothetical protein